ncbi:MAG: lysophospholipid acyltransferase family protein [Pirellulaceae bacterium]
MKIKNRLVIRIAAEAFARTMSGLFWTLRTEFRMAVANTNPYKVSESARYFYSVWHDSMVIPVFAGKLRHSVALTSHHRDGSFVAQVLRSVGIATVRGSTDHGGADAVRRLMATVENKHVIITPDGPRGPRRRMSKGIVFLASRTGRAIVPTAFSSSRSWRIRGNWTDLVIPKPFAKIVLVAGEPIGVPQELPLEKLDEYVGLVQAAMDDLGRESDRLDASK